METHALKIDHIHVWPGANKTRLDLAKPNPQKNDEQFVLILKQGTGSMTLKIYKPGRPADVLVDKEQPDEPKNSP